MLFGLAAMAIPILIHILNRRRARRVEWGAMQFLRDSLAARNRRILVEELALMALRCLLLGALAFALSRPFIRGNWLPADSAGAQDVAIVIDGSLSMDLGVGGKSNFQRALEEARQAAGACRRGDAVSLVLAGPVCQSVIPSPISDRQAINAALDELTPVGGSMSAVDALQAAVGTLTGGVNPGKKIVLITDGQRLGWRPEQQQSWSLLAEAAGALPTRPVVILRRLEVPKQLRNLTLAGITLDRGIVGLDRPVQISISVANNGAGPSGRAAVETSVDGAVIDSRPLESLSPGSSGTIVVEHRFTSNGPHLVSSRAVCEDDLPADDSATRVVNVIKDLPVLLVEGQPQSRPLGSAQYIRLALSPPGQAGQDEASFVRPTVVDAAALAKIKDLRQYSAVVLCNVGGLSEQAGKDLSEYVAAGGGLLVVPGVQAQKDFYNNWTGQDGRQMTGCRLMQVKLKSGSGLAPGEKFFHVVGGSITHPALELARRYGLESAQIRGYWQLSPQADDENISVGALLDSSDPYLVARKYQRGLVLTLAVPLDPEFSDLPIARDCVVPLIHELVYYLAQPAQHPFNVQAGEKIVYDVPGKLARDQAAQMLSFDGRRLPVRLTEDQGHFQAVFDLTARPGLYRLALPPAALGELASRPAVQSSSASAVAGVPFVVMGNSDEGKFDLLSEEDLKAVGRHVQIAQADSLGQVLGALAGQTPGREIWPALAACVLGLVLAEIVLTRAIAAKRKSHLAQPVDFGSDAVDAAAFRSGAGRWELPNQEAPAP
jgi:hypothetical protein